MVDIKYVLLGLGGLAGLVYLAKRVAAAPMVITREKTTLYETTHVHDLEDVYSVGPVTVTYRVGWATDYPGLVEIETSEDGVTYTLEKTVDGYGHRTLMTSLDLGGRRVSYFRISTTKPPYLDYSKIEATVQ